MGVRAPHHHATEGPLWAIGDPGRAATEVQAGRPVDGIRVADLEADSASLAGMQVRAASVRGVLHVRKSQPRQDAYALSSRVGEDREVLIAAVCDGVGSLGRSHEAAALVSGALVAAAASGRSWTDAFADANSELAELANSRNGHGATHTDADDMATTAIGLQAWREDDEWVGGVSWVGDSSCWHLDDEGTWSPVAGVVQDAEDAFYTGSVAPLPSGDGACESAAFRLRGGALFLMTDGVANPLQWSGEVRTVLGGWWAAPPDLTVFAGQAGFARKSHMDDRTVVGVWPDEPVGRS